MESVSSNPVQQSRPSTPPNTAQPNSTGYLSGEAMQESQAPTTTLTTRTVDNEAPLSERPHVLNRKDIIAKRQHLWTLDPNSEEIAAHLKQVQAIVEQAQVIDVVFTAKENNPQPWNIKCDAEGVSISTINELLTFGAEHFVSLKMYFVQEKASNKITNKTPFSVVDNFLNELSKQDSNYFFACIEYDLTFKELDPRESNVGVVTQPSDSLRDILTHGHTHSVNIGGFYDNKSDAADFYDTLHTLCQELDKNKENNPDIFEHYFGCHLTWNYDWADEDQALFVNDNFHRMFLQGEKIDGDDFDSDSD